LNEFKIFLGICFLSVFLLSCGGDGEDDPNLSLPLAGSNSSSGDTTAPVIRGNTGTVDEGVFNVTYDPDTVDEDANLTYAFNGGTDDADFEINQYTGALTFKTAPDFETKNSYSVNIRVTDTAGNVGTQTVTITVNDVAEAAPVLTNTSFNAIREDLEIGGTIGTVITDTGGSPITNFVFTSGTDNDKFAIDNNGKITLVTSLDYETKKNYTNLRVQATNSVGTSNEATVMIFVTNVADVPPTLTAFTSSVVEGAAIGTTVGTITTNIGDGPITSYNLTGTGDDKFSVDSTGKITVAGILDFETTNSYSLKAKASNAAGESNEVDVTITITDVAIETAPVLTAFTGSIAEGLKAGTEVGTIITDAGGQAITAFSLTGDGNTNFNVSLGGVITTTSMLDFETTNTYNLQATATNASGDSNTVNVTINVTDRTFFDLGSYQASDKKNESGFGRAVQMDGNYIVVGGESHSGTANHTGDGVYVFKKDGSDNLSQVAKLTYSGIKPDDLFAQHVAISGNYIVVSENRNDDTATNSGAAYVFKNNGNDVFTQIAKLKADTPVVDGRFGLYLKISGDYIFAPAMMDGDTANDSGAVYVFKNNGSDVFSQVAKLQGSGNASSSFGLATAISGNLLFASEKDTGRFYTYQNNGSDVFSVATSYSSTITTGFAEAIDVENSYLVAGSPREDTNTGKIYFYKQE
jgi:hypothetical protein